MDKSPNLGLHLTPESDSQKKFIDYRTELSGDGGDSNMMILDAKMKELMDSIDKCRKKAFTWGDLKNGSVESSEEGE